MRQGAQPRAALCPSCRAQLSAQSLRCTDCQTPRPIDGWPVPADEAPNTMHAALTYNDELPPSIAPPMMIETPTPLAVRPNPAPVRPSTPATAPVRPIKTIRPDTPATAPERPATHPPIAPAPLSVPLTHHVHEPPSMSTHTLHTSTPTVIPARSLWAVTVAGLLLLIGITALALWIPTAGSSAAGQRNGPALNLPDSSAADARTEPIAVDPVDVRQGPAPDYAESAIEPVLETIATLPDPERTESSDPGRAQPVTAHPNVEAIARPTPAPERSNHTAEPSPRPAEVAPSPVSTTPNEIIDNAVSVNIVEPIAPTPVAATITQPVAATPEVPQPKAFDPTPLSGDWNGTLFGREWRMHVDLRADGSVTGSSQILAGARYIHNPLSGSWTQGDQGVHITVTEVDAERPTTHVGTLHSKNGAGYTTVGGRKRGSWDLHR